MTKRLDLSGNRYGKLVAIMREDDRPSHWVCRCDCGNLKTVYRGHLRSNHTTSCGCKKTELKKTHGMTGTVEYLAWQNIIQRTTNPKHPQFKYWGGRGIKVSEEWRDFKNFYIDMGKRPSVKHSVDRIDNNGNYELGNCKWSTNREQNLNTRRTTKVTFNGITMSKTEWAEALKINYITLCSRFNRGWSLDKVLSVKNYSGSNQYKEVE